MGSCVMFLIVFCSAVVLLQMRVAGLHEKLPAARRRFIQFGLFALAAVQLPLFALQVSDGGDRVFRAISSYCESTGTHGDYALALAFLAAAVILAALTVFVQVRIQKRRVHSMAIIFVLMAASACLGASLGVAHWK